MPRSVFASRVLPKLGSRATVLKRANKEGHYLYNAKRQVPTSHGIRVQIPKRYRALLRDPESEPSKARIALKKLEEDPFDETWRNHVSSDVSQFIDDMEAQGTKMLPEEKLACIKNPPNFFSRPQNVPTSLRQQVYFPDFSVTLVRDNRYGPYYARFYVPLEFNKLDMKSYLKELYNVDTVHIRSWVSEARIGRRRTRNPYDQGPQQRGRAKKNMIVQLVEPFRWPKMRRDLDLKPFESEQFKQTMNASSDAQARRGDVQGLRLNKPHRKTIAQQAEDILKGKMKWQPTWHQLPQSRLQFGNSTIVEPGRTTRRRMIDSERIRPGQSKRVKNALKLDR